MKTDVPKVLHEVCGRPMLAYVLDACRQVGVAKIYVVVGFGADQVKERFGSDGDIVWVRQEQQNGTAHAVMCCKEHLADFEGQTLVLCGDGPLIRAETLETVIETHEAENSTMTLATAVLDDPSGYGRIDRNGDGNLRGIVEHKDCTNEQLAINEVNPSYYLFDNKVLFEALDKVRSDNASNEYYLTDALSIIIEAGHKVAAVTAVRAEEAVGVNTKEQLGWMNEIMSRRIEESRMSVEGRSGRETGRQD